MNTATKIGEHPVRRYPTLLRFFAHAISVVFHPLFISVYVVFFLAFIHPTYFSGFSEFGKKNTLVILLLNAVLFPLFSILVTKGVGFIESIMLRTQRDRIIPYILCGIFFFWTYWVFNNQHQYPRILVSFMLGVFLSVSAALLANIYFKISMHAIGMGGLLGIFVIIMKSNTMLMTWPLSLALLITGLVCTSRMIVSDHSQKDIYAGLALGLIFQFISAYVVG